MMTINEIYATYTTGSQGFCKAIEAHCGYNLSITEIKRIADKSPTAEEFQATWENDDSWTDENNGGE